MIRAIPSCGRRHKTPEQNVNYACCLKTTSARVLSPAHATRRHIGVVVNLIAISIQLISPIFDGYYHSKQMCCNSATTT